MKLSQFKFKLPEELIALYPHSLYREFETEDGGKETFRFTRRDECKLMGFLPACMVQRKKPMQRLKCFCSVN